MITINLELWQNPNFPPLEILESRTNTVLENFNRCRKLNIKLQIRNDKIEEFYPYFNSLTERRAIESLRLSMYAEDVDIYLKLLSEENTSIGVVLETLSSLLDTAQERHENTKMLKEEYQLFLEKFNSEFSNIKINLTSDDRQIITRNEAFESSRYLSSIDKWIKFVNYTIPFLAACITFIVIPKISKFLIGNGLMYSYLLYKGKEHISLKYQDNKEKLQSGGRVLENNNNNNSIKDNGRNSENHPRETFLDILISPIKNLFNKGKEYLYQNVQDIRRTNEDINFGLPINDYSTDTDNLDSSDVLTVELGSATKTNELVPTAKLDSATTDLGKIDPAAANSVVGSDPIKSLHVGEMVPASSYSSIDIIIAGFVSVCIGYFIYKYLCGTKATQRRWWIKYYMKRQSKFRQTSVSDEQQQIIEKDNKILEIKDKLPVIIQNVEILDQFWDYQVINIKSHIETLSSVDENEKIRFPKQMAVPIKEKWNKQYNESKTNYVRMKDSVTRNSLLSID